MPPAVTCANILEEIKELLEKLGSAPSDLHLACGAHCPGLNEHVNLPKRCKVSGRSLKQIHPRCRQQCRGQTSGTSVSAPVLKVDLCKKLVAYPRDTERWASDNFQNSVFMGWKGQNRFLLTPRAHMTNTISLLDFAWLLIS